MEKVLKITIILIIIIATIFQMNCIYADNWDSYKPGDDPGITNGINSKAGIIVGIIRTIGLFVSIGALMAIGIKYMLGSVEEKAEYKKAMIPYLIGAILVFAITWLPTLIYNVVKDSNLM